MILKESSDEEDKIDEKLTKTVNNNNNNVTNSHVSEITTTTATLQPIKSSTSVTRSNEPVFAICYACQKSSNVDQMIHCSSCPRYSHPSCLELNPKLVDWNCVRNYNWQCMECKICSNCNDPHDEVICCYDRSKYIYFIKVLIPF